MFLVVPGDIQSDALSILVYSFNHERLYFGVLHSFVLNQQHRTAKVRPWPTGSRFNAAPEGGKLSPLPGHEYPMKGFFMWK